MALDSVGPSGGAGVGQTASPTTWTHTTVAASTTVLVFACLDGIAPGAAATATLGGTTMTQLGSDVACGTGGTTGFLRVWSVSGVAAGAHTIVVTCATQNDMTGGSVAYITTGLGTPVTNAGSATGTTAFITVAASTSGNTIVGFVGGGQLITATTGPAVSRVGFGTVGTGSNLEGGAGASGGNAACSDRAAGGSVTITWSTTTGSAATFAVEVGAAPGGQSERMPQQLSRITKHRRGASQRPQFNVQLPSVNIIPPQVTASATTGVPVVLSGQPCLNGTGGVNSSTTAGWFTDSLGNRKLWVATETWVLPTRAGEWNGGNWQSDYTNFFNARSAQGFTVTMTDAIASNFDSATNPPFADGRTWDGLTPFVTGTDPSSGLNNTFWTRIDYMFAAAAAVGMTIGFVFNSNYDSAAGGPMNGWTNTQAQAYGTALGNRYKNTPNLVWLFGNDCFQGTFDTTWDFIRTGLTGAGDTHMVIAWWEPEYTSRRELDNSTVTTWGVNNSAANFVYTYNCGYFGVEYAYSEVASHGASVLLPAFHGDGYFYQGTSGAAYSSTFDRAYRQEWWWVLTSGGRGVFGEAENVMTWSSAASLTAVTGDWFFANNAKNIVTTYTGLYGWWNLLPDLSSAFVTAGRGTRATGFTSGGGGGQYEPAFTNSYVSASITADGTLAICYLPNSTTITCTTSMLAPGWAASWIDPVTGASSSAGGGPTFNSTAKGTNSRGDPDWVLVFQAPVSLPELVMATRIAP